MASEPVYSLIMQIRRLFQRLKTVGEEILQGTGINPSQRAILEFLYQRQSHSVPQIAEYLSVTRQHVQVIVNDLVELDLARCLDNPAHKRSPLVEATPEGIAMFESIQQKEAEILRQFQRQLPEKDIRSALKVLESLDKLLSKFSEKKL